MLTLHIWSYHMYVQQAHFYLHTDASNSAQDASAASNAHFNTQITFTGENSKLNNVPRSLREQSHMIKSHKMTNFLHIIYKCDSMWLYVDSFFMFDSLMFVFNLFMLMFDSFMLMFDSFTFKFDSLTCMLDSFIFMFYSWMSLLFFYAQVCFFWVRVWFFNAHVCTQVIFTYDFCSLIY